MDFFCINGHLSYITVMSVCGYKFMILGLVLLTVGDCHELARECVVDDDRTSPELKRCLQLGNEYLERYLTHVRRSQRRPVFDKCGEFNTFHNCMRPLIEKCPAITQERYAHWKTIHDVIHCSCTSPGEECASSLLCFEDQYKEDLTKRCDAYFRFNLRQQTRDKCAFLEESIRCKESLMTSACGAQIGMFAFHVFHVISEKKLRKHQCVLSRENKYEGFSYSEDCPSDLSSTLTTCRESHLEGNLLEFHNENDLVAHGRKKEVRQACKHYRYYNQCVNPIKKKCKEGMRLVYEYDGRLRTYLMKMKYICGENKSEYARGLKCYRGVLKNKTLSACDPTWNQLQPMLEKVTAYEFYCKRKTSSSQDLVDVLTKLRQCYEDVFLAHCGQTAGRVIGGLMENVFQDPFYLRYDYKPYCKLHKKYSSANHPYQERSHMAHPDKIYGT